MFPGKTFPMIGKFSSAMSHGTVFGQEALSLNDAVPRAPCTLIASTEMDERYLSLLPYLTAASPHAASPHCSSS